MFLKTFLASLLLATLLTSDFVAAEDAQIAAQTITSELKIWVYVYNDGSLLPPVRTPGTVAIPQCTRRCFLLAGLNEENVETYKKELDRLQIRCVGLPNSVTDAQLKTYGDTRLLTDTTSLDLASCNNLADLRPLAKLQEKLPKCMIESW